MSIRRTSAVAILGVVALAVAIVLSNPALPARAQTGTATSTATSALTQTAMPTGTQAATSALTQTVMPTETQTATAAETQTTTPAQTGTTMPAETEAATSAGTQTPTPAVTSTATVTATATRTPTQTQLQNLLPAARTITVVGRGEVKVEPDVANTTVGVEALAPTVDAAMEDAQERMDAVLTALRQLGIADRDIQTSNFSINFERSQPGMPDVTSTVTSTESLQPAGFYRVSNMVQITIRDLEQVGPVLDAAVKAGANNVWGITFGLDDTDALEEQAREAAVADARARAESLAELNGVTVGDVVAISEVIGNMPGVMYSAAEGRGGGGGTPIEPGEVAFTTQIQIVYAIE